MKRIISFLLALILVLPCLPGVARAEIVGECGDDLLWYYDDGVLTVSGTGPMFSYAYEDTPWNLGAMDVREVVLEEGVTEIGSFAFRDCGNLTSVTLPSTLCAIDQGAFAYCDSLCQVSIPDLTAWTQVDFACWYEESYDEALGAWREDEVCSNPLSCNENVILYVDGEKATTVTLPDDLTAIGANSFRGYQNLTALYLPASVKTIGDYAFEGCTGLKDVYYSGTPTQVASIRYGEGKTLLMRATWHFDEGPHSHQLSKWETVTEPSCTEPGLEQRHCTNCDHSETREIPAAGHTYGSWSTVKSSTASAEGNQRRVCKECDAVDTRPIPRIPTVSISGDAASGKPKLSWKAVKGADKYRIYRSTSKSGTYSTLTTTSKTTYTDTSAKAGTNYYYKVRALDSKNNLLSGYSAVVNRMCDLARPTVSVSVNTSTGKPVVKWETVSGASKYYVYRSTKKDSGYTKVYSTSKARSYTDTSATVGKTYYYKVLAVHSNTSANSAYSTVLSQVCDLARPTVSISRNSKGQPYLKWSTVRSAKSYRIYRSKSSSGTYSYLGTTTSLKYADKTAKAGTKYYYKIRAVHSNSNANSAYSSPKAIQAK